MIKLFSLKTSTPIGSNPTNILFLYVRRTWLNLKHLIQARYQLCTCAHNNSINELTVLFTIESLSNDKYHNSKRPLLLLDHSVKELIHRPSPAESAQYTQINSTDKKFIKNNVLTKVNYQRKNHWLKINKRLTHKIKFTAYTINGNISSPSLATNIDRRGLAPN